VSSEGRREGAYVSGEGELDALLHFAEESCVPLESVSIYDMEEFLCGTGAIVATLHEVETLSAQEIDVIGIGAVPESCTESKTNKRL
jgi:hypothetical protein